MANNQELTEITIGYPKSTDDITLELELGACKAEIGIGETQYWVEGTYEHPVGAIPPRLDQDGGRIRLSQDFTKWANFLGFNKPPYIKLALSNQKPFALRIRGGATEAAYNLGGLPLTNLSTKTGAGKFTFVFDEPNLQVMELFEVETGAAGFEAKSLANANFKRMKIQGGAAGFELDFGGTLQADAEVEIEVGVAAVELRIPAGTATRVYTEATLGSVEAGDGFLKKEGMYVNEAMVSGQTPILTIRAKVAVGTLELKQV